MRNLLRTLLLISMVFMLSFSISAEGKIRNLIVLPLPENIDEDWIVSVVQDKLEANLSTYAEISIIDTSNDSFIRDLQRASEGGEFDESTMIEIGKKKNASHCLFLKIRKIYERYSLTATITDLSTSEVLVSSFSSDYRNVEDLYNTSGSAVDKLTVDLCEQLGIELSSSTKYEIMNGTDDRSIEEKIAQNKREEEVYNKQIKELSKKIEILSKSTDIGSDSEQARLEADRNAAREKLDLILQNNQRLAEEQAKKEADEKSNKARSEKQQKKLSNKRDELGDVVGELRAAKMERASTMGQLNVIESKKKNLVEIWENIEVQKQELIEDFEAERTEKIEKIQNQELTAAQIDKDGNLTAAAQMMRDDAISAVNADVDEKELVAIEKLHNSVKAQEELLLKSIEKDYSYLKNKKINTLGNELKVSFQSYDGTEEGWNFMVYFDSEGIPLYQAKSFLSYKTLTRKEPIRDYKNSRYDEYLETVDFYDSILTTGEPYLTLELSFSVTPFPEDQPSKYEFSFTDLKFYKTEDISVKKGKMRMPRSIEVPFTPSTSVRQFSPSYDIRTLEVRQTLAAKEEAVYQRQLKEEQDRIARENAKEEADYQKEIERQAKLEDARIAREEAEYQRQIKENQREQERQIAQEEARREQYYIEREKEEQRQEKEARRREKEEEKRRKREADTQDWAYQDLGHGRRSFIGAEFVTGTDCFTGYDFAVDVCIGMTPYLFLNICYAPYVNASQIYEVPQGAANIDLGLNKRLHFGRYHPNLFASLGFGIGGLGRPEVLFTGGTKVEDFYYFGRASTGIDFPIFRFLYATFTYSLDWNPKYGFSDRYSLSGSIYFN